MPTDLLIPSVLYSPLSIKHARVSKKVLETQEMSAPGRARIRPRYVAADACRANDRDSRAILPALMQLNECRTVFGDGKACLAFVHEPVASGLDVFFVAG
jgi:hypothetical protein